MDGTITAPESPTTDTSARVTAPSAMRSAGSFALLFIGVTFAYFALAKGGLQLASLNPSASPIWPPAGLAVAAVVLWGQKRVVAPLFLGAFLANVTTTGVIASSLAIAAGNSIEALIIGALLNRLAGGKNAFETPARVARFVAISLVSGTLVGATVGVGTLILSGSASPSEALLIWMTWWLGDTAGVLVVAPVIVLWSVTNWNATDRKGVNDRLAVFASAIVVGVIAFSPVIGPSFARAPLGFLAILPLLAAALRLNQRDTATVALILSAFAVWGTMLGSGPFVQTEINNSYLLLVAFMLSISVPSLALSADAAERRRQEKELRAIVYQAQMGIAQCNTKGRFLAVNDKYCEIVGRPAPEVLTLRREDVTAPEDRAHDNEMFDEACATGHGFNAEKRILRPDGTIVWIWNNVTPIVDENGNVQRVVSMCADMTERHNAEERQTMLMAELNHRVRNTLATIQAMARLTSQQAVSKESYVESLQGRIATMARTHELLTRERWQGVSFEELLHDELNPYAPRGESVSIKGPKLKLRPRQALDLALAVHELTTNAAKYGALSTPEGRVSVTWTISRPEGEPYLELLWQESGGPPVAPPTKRGFGSQLIRNTFGGLNKKAEFDYRPEGLRCLIGVPLDRGGKGH